MAHSTRPTLPPLHTLDLPRTIHESYAMNRQDLPPICYERHRPPIPPPTPSPRTPSPPALRLCACADSPVSTLGTSPTPLPARKVRLVPTSLENADAVVFVPAPSVPNAPPSQPLLLVGPALARLRHPQRQLAKGARIHPYRIARPCDRRPLHSHPIRKSDGL